MLFVFADIFVQGGINEVTTINALYAAMYPITIPIGIFTLLRTRYQFMRRRASWWQTYPLTFISFAGFLILGLVLTGREMNTTYVDWINPFMVYGMNALFLIMAVGILAGAYRTLIFRRSRIWVQLTLMAGFLLTLLLLSGVLDMISPLVGNVGRWENMFLSSPMDDILYYPEYIASLFFFITVILLRERLRP
jgi:hypothetical protein